MRHVERVQLPPQPESVRAGRHLVELLLADWGAGELSDLAALLASELLTNAVTHANTALDLQVILSDPVLPEHGRRLDVMSRQVGRGRASTRPEPGHG